VIYFFPVIQLVASADCAGALDITDDLQHLLVSMLSTSWAVTELVMLAFSYL
jgi:hypothetical protein